MDKPNFYNIFDTTISFFYIENISTIINLIRNFLKNNKLKKMSEIKNYESIDKIDNLLKFKEFKPILNLLTPSISKYMKFILKNEYIKFNYTKVFYHVDKKYDLNTNYNFNDSDFTLYLCLQNYNINNDSLILLNPINNMFKLDLCTNDSISKEHLTVNNLNISLKVGKAIIFPSYITHFLHQNKVAKERIFLVMNIKLI